MEDLAETSAMQRKAGIGRPAPEINRPTPERLLRAAFAQAGAATGEMVLEASDITIGRATIEPFAETLEEGALIVLCEGAGEQVGLMVLDAQMLGGLVEMLTIGRVSERPSPARAPSRTDAILASDFIDRLFIEFERACADAGLALTDAISGYRYQRALFDGRAARLALDDIPFRHFDVRLEIGGGGRQGRVQILLPVDPPRHEAGSGVQAWSAALEAAVAPAHAVLDAVLVRRRMSLSEAMSLVPGQVLTIARESLQEVALVDADGRQVCLARLGQAGGQRALRLRTPGEMPKGGGLSDEGGVATGRLVPPAAPARQEPAADSPVDVKAFDADVPGGELAEPPGSIDGMTELTNALPAGDVPEDLPGLAPQEAGGDLPSLDDLAKLGGE